MVKSSSPNAPSTWLVFLCPRTHASMQNCHHSASSVLASRISCCVIAAFLFEKQQEKMEKSVNTHNRIRYFLTNKIFLLQFMSGYVSVIFIVKCVTIASFLLLMQHFGGKAWFLLFCHPLETVHDTVQYRYCIFSSLYRLVRIRLKR